MATYALGARTIQTAAATAACEIRATSANKPRVMEIGFTQTAAPTTATTYALGRPAAIGLAPVTTTYELDEVDKSGIDALANIATAWGTAPTVPVNFFRRVTANNIAGVGMIWTAARGMLINVSTSLVLWLVTTPTPSFLDVWCVVDE